MESVFLNNSVTVFELFEIFSEATQRTSALEGYSDSLRCEMLPCGVKVICIQPAIMRTALAMSFADGWLKGFKDAEPARKVQYGDDWAEKVAAGTKQTTSDIAADPQKTVVRADARAARPLASGAHHDGHSGDALFQTAQLATRRDARHAAVRHDLQRGRTTGTSRRAGDGAASRRRVQQR